MNLVPSKHSVSYRKTLGVGSQGRDEKSTGTASPTLIDVQSHPDGAVTTVVLVVGST